MSQIIEISAAQKCRREWNKLTHSLNNNLLTYLIIIYSWKSLMTTMCLQLLVEELLIQLLFFCFSMQPNFLGAIGQLISSPEDYGKSSD